jgi:hypothetical protein
MLTISSPPERLTGCTEREPGAECREDIGRGSRNRDKKQAEGDEQGTDGTEY